MTSSLALSGLLFSISLIFGSLYQSAGSHSYVQVKLPSKWQKPAPVISTEQPYRPQQEQTEKVAPREESKAMEESPKHQEWLILGIVLLAQIALLFFLKKRSLFKDIR